MAGAGNPVVPELHVAVDDVSVQHVRGADEAGDERGGRIVVDLVRRAHLFDPALVHDDDPVRELERLVLVVGHQQAGDPELLVQVVEPVPELLAHPCIQRTERLVEQEDLGPGRERPRERDPLPLTTGELVGVPVPEPRQLHELEEILHTSALLGLRLIADRQPERDVLRHRHVAEQRVVLEDEPDPPFLDGLDGVLLPSIQIRPAVGSSRPAIIRSTVLLPEPLGPRSAVMLPASAVNVTSSTASNPPKRFQRFSTRIGVPVDLACGRHVRCLLLLPAFEDLDQD